MGSQSVTNFSKDKKSAIRGAFQEFFSGEASRERVSAAVGAAIGPLNKSNPFVQCLSSPSVKNGLGLLVTLGKNFQTLDPENALEEYEVDVDAPQPLFSLIARMTEGLAKELTATQEETDSAFAARDAITRTIIDAVSESAGEERIARASPADISKAFKALDSEKLATMFFENLISSLLSLTLDAARVHVDDKDLRRLVKAAQARVLPANVRTLMETTLAETRLGKSSPARTKRKLEKVEKVRSLVDASNVDLIKKISAELVKSSRKEPTGIPDQLPKAKEKEPKPKQIQLLVNIEKTRLASTLLEEELPPETVITGGVEQKIPVKAKEEKHGRKKAKKK